VFLRVILTSNLLCLGMHQTNKQSNSNLFFCGTNTGRALFLQFNGSEAAISAKEVTRSSGGAAVGNLLPFGLGKFLGKMVGAGASASKAAPTSVMSIAHAPRPVHHTTSAADSG
jgi:hypothetical protein